jgi:hypothetical protein
MVINPYFETVTGTHFDLTACTNPVLMGFSSEAVWRTMKVILTTDTRGLQVLGGFQYDNAQYRSIVTDSVSAGITAMETAEESADGDNSARAMLSEIRLNSPSYPTWYASHYLNGIAFLDRCLEAGAQPTTGTYRTGAIVWNNGSVIALAAGQPMGWMCKQYGTSDVIATTASGVKDDYFITVASAAGLKPGQAINIAAPGPGQVYINRIVGTKVYISVQVPANFPAGTAVTNFAPVWLALPNY